MRRTFTRDRHWLLLSILLMLIFAMAPRSRAQSSLDDQDPQQNDPQQNDPQQDQAQGADAIQGQDPVQGQNPGQFVPNDDAHDSHARIVRISYVGGEVRIDHGQGYESATMNVPVAERNWLQTRSDGWAEVQLEDGSTIRLAPDTVIAFSELSRLSSGGTVTTVDLDQGEALFKITAHDDSQFQVAVKNKTITLVHSGAFRVTSTNADPMDVVVWKGEVGIHDSESGAEVAVKKNETFVLDPTDPAQYALDRGAEADGLDQWSKQRDDYLSTYAARGGNLQSPYQYGASDLDYYGAYFDADGYGTVWQPYDVNLGWNPFMNGYWAYSPGFGYTWVSSYPWGWMPYRYGRWVYINHRGWCWAPGGWGGWHTGPRWVNAPAGFRPPAPPANSRVVVGGSPGRVIRPGTPWDRGGSGRHPNAPDAVNRPDRSGRPGNGDDGNQGGGRGNRRVYTNDDIARVPRTDTPATTHGQGPGPGPKIDVPPVIGPKGSGPGSGSGPGPKIDNPPVIGARPGTGDGDRNPRVAVQPPGGDRGGQRDPSRFSGDRDVPRAPIVNRQSEPPAERPRALNPPPAPPQVSQPVRQYTPPPSAPVHQYTPPPAPAASAPARSYSPPAETHSAPSNSGDRGGRPK
jgi:hypothetical protein